MYVLVVVIVILIGKNLIHFEILIVFTKEKNNCVRNDINDSPSNGFIQKSIPFFRQPPPREMLQVDENRSTWLSLKLL